MSENVAIIGLGAMGRRMAGRLLDAGFDVVVWNRSAGPAADLVARGARAAE
ncbi:MAG: NAD(P)-binding domain-containing protein, partial [Myxococcales bacterium]|nr:NAD(P)-binding domain-containing protein [Myxococcales bacterium]